MRCIVSGHRLFKLESYNIEWIKHSIETVLARNSNEISIAYSGMASGVDLWFCDACSVLDIPYIACIPFQEQEDLMADDVEKQYRATLIKGAKEVLDVRNSYMVEHCDLALVVWDGNKGGTHNVLQQLIEKKKDFYWINPVKEVIWSCI